MHAAELSLHFIPAPLQSFAMVKNQNQSEFKFEAALKPKTGNDLRVYTVSQINSLIKTVLQNHLPPRLAVTGEITDLRLYQSGHCYFTIKDESAQLPCVMWNSNFKKLKFKLQNGMAVVTKGNIDVYEPSGKYQFYAETIEPEGVGALRLAFEQMVKRLEAAGLFDEAHKKPLPPYPFRIGIVTSESGAAVHDISSSIFTRWPPAKLLLYPVPVQGEGAADAIALAIRNINRRNKKLQIDLLIVGRGGGSLEDLWAFNEEVLARAIYDSKIPIISAVGHEIDTAISDLVADARAATPTKAAVIAVPDVNEVIERIEAIQNNLHVDMKSRLRFYGQNLNTICAAALFRNPQSLVQNAAQQTDEKADAIQHFIRQHLTALRQQLQLCFERVVQIEPHRLLGRKAIDLNNLQNRAAIALRAGISRETSTLQNIQTRLEKQIWQVLAKSELTLTASENRLAGLNPRAVLLRGYSIVRNKKNGKVITSPQAVEIGDLIVNEFAGEKNVESRVEGK
jgi:exodeoxyribonuclease VII large subunit